MTQARPKSRTNMLKDQNPTGIGLLFPKSAKVITETKRPIPKTAIIPPDTPCKNAVKGACKHLLPVGY